MPGILRTNEIATLLSKVNPGRYKEITANFSNEQKSRFKDYLLGDSKTVTTDDNQNYIAKVIDAAKTALAGAQPNCEAHLQRLRLKLKRKAFIELAGQTLSFLGGGAGVVTLIKQQVNASNKIVLLSAAISALGGSLMALIVRATSREYGKSVLQQYSDLVEVHISAIQIQQDILLLEADEPTRKSAEQLLGRVNKICGEINRVLAYS
jgi:hypothetical protein